MRVAYIADIGIAGGATRSLIELVSTLKSRHGIDPVVFTSSNSILNQKLNALGIENYAVGHGAFLQGAPDAQWKKPIKYILFGAYYWLHRRRSLQKAMKSINWSAVDLIHTNVARDDIGMEIAKRTGIPNLCSIREFAELDFGCWSYRFQYVKYLSRHVTHFMAISKAVKKHWIEKGLAPRQISVVYNGVDADQVMPADHTSWRTDKELKLVIAGGVIPNKGQWRAIEAVCMLPEAIRRHVRLDIIGGITKHYQDEIMKPAVLAGIEQQIHILGSTDSVFSSLKQYHVGLMCSKMEGFGRVTAEYMHAGLAVIASDSGANAELITHDETGLLYCSAQTKALSDSIKCLFEDRKKLIRLAEAGKQEAEKRFTAKQNAQNIFAVYCRFAKQPENPAISK